MEQEYFLDELIQRIASAAGISAEAARKSLSAFLSYLDANAPKERMAPFYKAAPGIEGLVVKPKGGLFGMFSGGLMSLYSDLTSAGLSTTQMQKAGEAMLGFAREKVGDEEIDRLVASVPALRQLL